MSYHSERPMIDQKKAYKEACQSLGKIDHVYVLKPFKSKPLTAVTHPKISPIKRFTMTRRKRFKDWCHNHQKTVAILLFFRLIFFILIGFHAVGLLFLLPMIVRQCAE